MRLLAITPEQQNIFATHITLGMEMSGQKTFYAKFDVYVAFVQYTSRTLFVDFRFSYLKDSKIVCLHIQNIVTIIFQR